MTADTATDSAPTGADAPSQARISCSGVTVRFGGLVAVNDVSLTVPPATIVGLVGPNGAGKSTLFGVLSGLIRPSQGTVLLDGADITDTRPQLRAARGLARTFQHPELFTSLTIRDHLVLAYRAKYAKRRIWSDLFTMGSLRPRDKAETARIDEILALLGITGIADRVANGLPLGVARLVELGRALAAQPTVLLLDEPSSGLDSKETEQFATVLATITRERGISALLVEHDVELVMRLCSAIYVLDFGTLIASGTPDEVRADPAVRAAYLGEEISAIEENADETIAVAEVTEVIAPNAAADGAPVTTGVLLTVEALSVRYGEAAALEGVSFEVGSGQGLAVLGANGAGKSSMARAISGLVPAHGGRILFDGQDITSWAPHRIRRAGLIYLPEGRSVFRGLTVMDNLRMAARTVPGRRARRHAIDLALEIFPALAARRHQTAGLLSGGEQQMLSLARALATSPKLVIADEMSLGLAPKMVDAVFDGLTRAQEAGVTVVMIEQYVHRALDFADDCLVLQRGAVAWKGVANTAGSEVLRHYLGEAMTAGS